MKYINSTRHTGQNLTKNVSLFCQVLVWLFAKLCGSVSVAKGQKNYYTEVNYVRIIRQKR